MSLSRKPVTDLVEPDLPITPMLDMSFQLLAFFIMTFRPSPTEGQIAISIPPIAGANGPIISDGDTEPPAKFIAKIVATERGTIESITLREESGLADKELGADVPAFLKELKVITTAEERRRDVAAARGTKIPPPKLTIEVSDKLVQASVVQVFDAALQAGFKDVATVPIDKSKR